MFHHTRRRNALACLFLLCSVLYILTTDYYGLELAATIAVFAILAMSLDLVAGFAGMVSLCHAAFLGIGAYVYAILTLWYGTGTGPAILAGILASMLSGVLVGVVTARIHGIFLIVVTLVLGQMAHSFFFRSSLFGRDDGIVGVPRTDLSALGLDSQSPVTFALVLLGIVALVYLFLSFLLTSGFGRALEGIREDANRMRALGLNPLPYRVAALAVSAGVAGLAGILGAQHLGLVSPDHMSWTVSGEILLMVILGGAGSLAGPAVGAAILVFLKHAAGSITSYWHLFPGLLFLGMVMTRSKGVYDLLRRGEGNHGR